MYAQNINTYIKAATLGTNEYSQATFFRQADASSGSSIATIF